MAGDRVPRIRELVEAGVGCEIGHALAVAGVTPFRCTFVVQGLHERRKRSSAGSLTVAANLIPACNWCNGWIEDNPREARDLFGSWLVIREADDEWEALGARQLGSSLPVRACETCSAPFLTLGPENGVWVAPCGHLPT